MNQATPQITITNPPAAYSTNVVKLPTFWNGLGIIILWLSSYLLFVFFNIWLWESQGAISVELMYLEARKALIFDLWQPHLESLVLTDAPLPLYLALLSGAAFNGAAILGASSVTLLALLFRRTRTPWFWFPLIVLHPAWLLLATQYPTALMRTLLLGGALAFVLAYLRKNETFPLLMGGLTLSALVLVDAHLWPLYLIFAAAIALARPRTNLEQLTLFLMILFPAFFLTGGWFYLNWVQSGDPFFYQHSPYAALANTDAWANVSLWQQYSALPVRDAFSTLLRFAPAYLLLLVLAIASGIRWLKLRKDATNDEQQATSPSSVPPRKRRTSTRRSWTRQEWLAWVGLVAVFLLPAIDGILASNNGRGTWAPLAVTFPLLTLPLLWHVLRTTRFTLPFFRDAGAALSTILLIGGLVTGWYNVWQQESEAQHLLHRAVSAAPALEAPISGFVLFIDSLSDQLSDMSPNPLFETRRSQEIEEPTTSSKLAPFYDVAGLLNQQIEPGTRLFFDHAELFPLLVLIEQKDAFLLPYQLEYDLARQEPAHWADYIVIADPRSSLGRRNPWGQRYEERLSDFDLLLQRGDLLLYKRRSTMTGSLGNN